ncbi:TetR family transcriptional regulator [Kocuria sp.]|uniref:TetR family transcriptional regulator n=1 Tax=Kocuria sp. TaxID=1871328 RepID=UPI0026E0FC7F|nr:TetR family transcriptional regulator [Kocuria sp.]MDO5619772.1 TetR family transcriptional regulator [Kocuria sp.]
MPLTREQVVSAALKVAGDYGLGDLSMRRVATELGVQAGALYWHVANKQELLIALSRRMLDPNDGAAPWPSDPAAVLVEFRERLLALRDGAEIVAVAHADQPAWLPPAQLLTAQLEARGVRGAAEHAQNLLRWVLGSVLTQQTAVALVAAAPAGHAGQASPAGQARQTGHAGLAGQAAAAAPAGQASLAGQPRGTGQAGQADDPGHHAGSGVVARFDQEFRAGLATFLPTGS